MQRADRARNRVRVRVSDGSMQRGVNRGAWKRLDQLSSRRVKPSVPEMGVAVPGSEWTPSQLRLFQARQTAPIRHGGVGPGHGEARRVGGRGVLRVAREARHLQPVFLYFSPVRGRIFALTGVYLFTCARTRTHLHVSVEAARTCNVFPVGRVHRPLTEREGGERVRLVRHQKPRSVSSAGHAE